MRRYFLYVHFAFCVIGCQRGTELTDGKSTPPRTDPPPSAGSGTPVAARFNPVNNFGLTQIDIDGQNLLVGNGFHIIGGQQPNLDVKSNQINSEDPSTKSGKMFIGGSTNGAVLPLSFKLNTAPDDASKLNFDLSVGPLPATFASISIPLEAKLQLFEYWRASDAPETVRRFDKIPVDQNYGGGVGSYAIASVPAGATWGEIVGSEYTIRVEITKSSRALPLFFVNAPDLATGVRDVEFSFGTVEANQIVTANGYIQVLRTDRSRLPKPPQDPTPRKP